MIGNTVKKPRDGQNLLRMIPLLRDGIELVGLNGRWVVHVPRKSWIEKQAVRFLKQPAVIKVSLDEMGVAVVARCDGNHSISRIADALKDEFGEAAEPLLPRLAKFIELMEANGWLAWKAPEAVPSILENAGSR